MGVAVGALATVAAPAVILTEQFVELLTAFVASVRVAVAW
jgi:hypothetical protein